MLFNASDAPEWVLFFLFIDKHICNTHIDKIETVIRCKVTLIPEITKDEQ